MTDKRSSWFRGWKLALVIYLGLLLLSHIWRSFEADQFELEPGQEQVTVHQVRGDSVLHDKTLQIAYRDEYRGEQEAPPVILLLHGSPVDTDMLPDITKRLSTQHRVITPDFPGYGASDSDLPDYSMKAFSVYMTQVLDSLSVDQAHVVGYSLGSGVGIYMSHLSPKKVESIDMLAGIGVQELELLGSYHLNHAVYGGQLFLTWLLHETVPHFGLLHDVGFHVPYALSFYESDQRPLRGLLKAYKKPMLIQHGREDGFVPLAAAREHHRIVPQSKLIIYDGRHDLIESHTYELVDDINRFVQAVESGEATTYAEASKERIRQAQKPFDNVNFAKAEGVTLFIMMFVIIVSTFVSEDLTCIGAGLLAARGLIGYWPAALACFLGIIIGDFAIFLMGKYFGKPIIRKRPIKWFVSEKDLENSSEWFKIRGPMIIIGSRFVPGSRFPTYFSAGMIGMSLLMFSLYFVIAAVIWTPILVGLAMLVGTELLRYFQVYQAYALWVVPFIILILLFFVKFIMPAVTWRGRRMIVSRWRRATRWEFWSPFIIYMPVACYIIYLWIKFGKLTTFTASNPGIPDGGFIGESKSAILANLESCGKVARFKKISANRNSWDRFVEARSYINEEGLGYPVTLKPDAGQRGAGVHFPENEDEMQEAIEQMDYDLIVQEYISGKEFGVFYYRYPDQDKGHILSITDKQLPTLTGDGEHTLEELILMDDYAVSLAKQHMQIHQDHLFDIPEEGEQIQLVKLGTHARGARFFDASHLITEQLERSMDKITSHFKGFYFGRFDIRVPSKVKLKQGVGLKILEVNGVTSESTVIYDPEKNYWDAQKLLMQQWRIAFEIGDINRRKGHPTSSVLQLIRQLLAYRGK